LNRLGVGRFGAIFGTSDGSKQWKSQQSNVLPNIAGQHLSATSCPAVGTCFAVGTDGFIIATSDGGATWKPQYSRGNTPLNGISCASVSACVAVGGGVGDAIIVATTDGGKSWIPQTPPTEIFDLSGVSCPSTTTCYAIGGSQVQMTAAIIGTANGGATWSTLVDQGTTVALNGITCTTTTACIAVGTAGVVLNTTDGWRSPLNPQQVGSNPDPLESVACSSVSNCLAVGQFTVAASADGGNTWSAQPSLADTLQGVSCVSSPSLGWCFAVTNDGKILTTGTAGSSWTQEAQIDGGLFGVAAPAKFPSEELGGGFLCLRTTSAWRWATMGRSCSRSWIVPRLRLLAAG
jgi:photosystem II stability/assembly factor-like uncharacterized protein